MEIKKAFTVLDLFRLRQKTASLLMSTGETWTEAVAGTGVSSLAPAYMYLSTGAAAGGTALRRAYTFGMGSPASVIRTFNFAKRVNIGFSVGVQVLNATSVRYVQLKAATTIGDLGAKGIGIKIANATLYGESFGSARGEVELMTLESTKEYRIEIQHDPVSGIIAWYVNGVLKGVQTTAANIPTAAEALTNLLCSVDNGATAAEVIMFVSPIEFLMEV